MQDLADDPYDESLPRAGGVVIGLMRWSGAFLSIAILAGVAVWTYRLGQRDAGAVPVIVALDGPMREAPEDPLGRTAPYQGLSVNAVLEGKAPPPRPAAAVLAPEAATLADEDKPAAELVPAVTETIAAHPDAPPAEPPVAAAEGPAPTPVLEPPPAEPVAGPSAPDPVARVAAVAATVPPGREPAPVAPPAAAPPERTTAPLPETEVAALAPLQAPAGELTRSLRRAAPAAETPAATAAPAATLPPVAEAAPPPAPAPAPVPAPVSEPPTARAPERVPPPPKRPETLVAALSPRPEPAPPGAPSAAPPPGPVEAATEAFPPKGTVLVQLGAFVSPEVAREEWAKLLKGNADLLGTRGPLVQRTNSAGRVFFRLRAEGFADLADAKATCSALIARGGVCITARQE